MFVISFELYLAFDLQKLSLHKNLKCEIDQNPEVYQMPHWMADNLGKEFTNIKCALGGEIAKY